MMMRINNLKLRLIGIKENDENPIFTILFFSILSYGNTKTH